MRPKSLVFGGFLDLRLQVQSSGNSPLLWEVYSMWKFLCWIWLVSWNADLFDVAVHHGELLREWLFFDKPRHAFESGTRKQRALPDYGGRGWHESRKQVMKDLAGLKRSYYMDPQPEGLLEWHMYEYELTNCTDCALYRLELKQVEASKKSGKAKAQSDSWVASLQHQIGRLSADLSQFEGQTLTPSIMDSRDSNRGKSKVSQKKTVNKGTESGPLFGAAANHSAKEGTPTYNYTAELQWRWHNAGIKLASSVITTVLWSECMKMTADSLGASVTYPRSPANPAWGCLRILETSGRYIPAELRHAWGWIDEAARFL